MSAPKSFTFVSIAVMALLLSIGYHSVGLAGPWMSLFVDTGPSDTGSATDDTAAHPDPTDDTGTTPDPADDTATQPDTGDDTGTLPGTGDDTATPPDTGDDTGTPPDTGDDTGDIPEVVDGDDTGTTGKSAAELAGEKGGCGCAAGATPATGLAWLGALFMAVRRRH
jgi:MYXO-CTERM domain-containing protein